MSIRRVLITGGAGFIGSHLVEALLERGLQVVVYDDLSMGKRANVPAAAEFVQGDVRDTDTLTAALRGADAVYHLAARVSIRDSGDRFVEDAGTNLMGTLSVLQACAQTRPQTLVLASSMAVYADSPTPAPVAEGYTLEPISAYGISKLAAEKYCLRLCPPMGIRPTVLRFFNTFGTRQTYTPYVGVITIFIRKLLAGDAPVIFGTGEQCRDFVHVSDIVAGCLLALECRSEQRIFNLGTGTATSVNQIAELVIRRMAVGVRPGHAEAQPGELQNCVADIDRARRLLGYAPRCRIEERIDEVIDYLRRS